MPSTAAPGKPVCVATSTTFRCNLRQPPTRAGQPAGAQQQQERRFFAQRAQNPRHGASRPPERVRGARLTLEDASEPQLIDF
jgi:hypothetical protein